MNGCNHSDVKEAVGSSPTGSTKFKNYMGNKIYNKIINLMTKYYPNDEKLGEKYREWSYLINGYIDDYCLKFPNNFLLGEFLRKKFK